MQQMVKDGVIFVKAATKEEGSMIRSWRMMTFDKDNGYWYGSLSVPLLLNLKRNGDLIAPARRELDHLLEVQATIDAERVKPDKDVRCYIEPPVKAKLYTHQKRAVNMALIEFGLIAPERIKESELEA